MWELCTPILSSRAAFRSARTRSREEEGEQPGGGGSCVTNLESGTPRPVGVSEGLARKTVALSGKVGGGWPGETNAGGNGE